MKKFIDAVRSIAFNIAFFGSTTVLMVLFIPALVMPLRAQRAVSLFWFATVYWCEKYIMGLDYRVVGRENLPPAPFIIAAKHQSAWETMKIYRIFGDTTGIIAKKELLDIPIWGHYGRIMGLVPIDRSKGKEAMSLMIASAREAVNNGHNVLAFPEGTRRPVGTPPAYKGGLLKIYEELHIPLVCVAHNAGLFWPKNFFWKKSGVITVEILPPIDPGWPTPEVFKHMVTTIEGATNRLCGLPSSNTAGH